MMNLMGVLKWIWGKEKKEGDKDCKEVSGWRPNEKKEEKTWEYGSERMANVFKQ